MIFENIMLAYCMGLLWGVLEEWNKRLLFIIWFIALIYFIIALCYGSSLTNDLYPWWLYLITIPSFIIGIPCGKSAFRELFKK